MSTQARTLRNPWTDRFINAVILGSAAFMVFFGVWALVSPSSFAEFVKFPEHEHFIHDAGAFQVGIGVTLLLGLLWRDPLATVLAGFFVGNTIHAYNHGIDLDLGGRDSDPWLLGLLSVVVGVALAMRLRQLNYVVGKVEASDNGALTPFVEQKTALLTTFRRDGTSVATPLSVVVDGDRAVFRSYEKAGKTKRLRNNGKVELTPSTTKGKPTGPSITAEAHRLDEAESKRAARLLVRKHPLLHGVVVPLSHRLGRTKFGHTVHFELTPTD